MVTVTKSSKDMMDLSYQPNKVDYLSKSTSNLYNKVDSYKSTYKNEDFKQVLSSKTNSKDQDTQKTEVVNKNITSNDKNTQANEATDSGKLDELKEKLKELEDETKEGKSVSNDELKEVLSELLNLLTKLGNSTSDSNLDGKINNEELKAMLKEINGTGSQNKNINSIMEKISELLKTDSVKNSLDNDSLKAIEKLLGNLSSTLLDDNTKSTKEIKNNLKNLLSEISNMVDNKENQSGRVINTEEMLNKDYSQDNTDDAATSKDNKAATKEDKFLNSLIDDKKDDSLNKINLFATRSSAIQNQGVTTVRGLTINKATFVDDLIKDVKFMNTNSLKELIVKVNPGNLGEITIKLVQEDGLMKANLKANSKETTALLSQNLTDIKKQLGEQNIKIADVNIELYQDDTTYFNEKGFEGNFTGEQNKQNNNSKNNILSEQSILNDKPDENLANENSNINMFV